MGNLGNEAMNDDLLDELDAVIRNRTKLIGLQPSSVVKMNLYAAVLANMDATIVLIQLLRDLEVRVERLEQKTGFV